MTGATGHAFPFAAIVGQQEMKLALQITAVDPGIGGVLVRGDRGTGKSTAVRALPGVLPAMSAVKGCVYGCDPSADTDALCADCREKSRSGAPKTTKRNPPVVDMPLGASEDRVVGALDIERALTAGEKVFESGLLARAHRGYLYVDEINLLEDHLVDLLLDVAATGTNVVEREGLSLRHPARFVLVGSCNPEEGDLRPQLLDRFGLAVEVATPTELAERVEVVRRADAYRRDPAGFVARYRRAHGKTRRAIAAAQDRVSNIETPTAVFERASALCLTLGTDGLRGELTLIRAAGALAALEGADAVNADHLHRMAAPALRHRLRRDPLDESGSEARIQRALNEHLAA